MNATTYKEIFKLIKANKLRLGYYRPTKFLRPDGSTSSVQARWFTNLEVNKRVEPLVLYKKYNELDYPKYDNYDAINVDKVKDIPVDYYGYIGVPISFLDKYNPDQFEIIGCSYNYGRPDGWSKDINMSVAINSKNVYKRLLIKRK